MQVRDVMQPSRKPIEGHESVQAAAKRMKREDVGCLVVGDQHHVEGIVTDRDLSVRCIADGKIPSATPVREVMSVGVIQCTEDESIGDVIERMIDIGVMRLPVVDRLGNLVGVISARDSVKSVPLSKVSQRKAHRVRFTKDILSSRGQVHHVPLQSVYVSGAKNHQDAEVEAVERFQYDHGVRNWKLSADDVDIEDDA